MSKCHKICVYIYIYIYIHKHTHTLTHTESLYRPRGIQEVKAPRFLDNRHVKLVKVVSCTHRSPLPPGSILGTHFCQSLSGAQGHSVAGRIMSHHRDSNSRPSCLQRSASTKGPSYNAAITSKTLERVAELRRWGLMETLHLHRNYDLINLWPCLLPLISGSFAFPLLSFSRIN